jgi:2'-5' RNA ligase
MRIRRFNEAFTLNDIDDMFLSMIEDTGLERYNSYDDITNDPRNAYFFNGSVPNIAGDLLYIVDYKDDIEPEILPKLELFKSRVEKAGYACELTTRREPITEFENRKISITWYINTSYLRIVGQSVRENKKEKSGKLYDYGCVMLYPKLDWNDMISNIDIDDKDLYNPEDPKFGLETSPHITLLYGLHEDVKDSDVKDILEKYHEIEDVKISRIGVFSNEEFDVLKFNITGSVLHKIHKELSKLDHTSDFDKYRPHMTIAYLKKGTAKKYTDAEFKLDLLNFTKISYKKTDGKKINVRL